MHSSHLCGRRLLDVGNEICALLRLLKTREDHFCAGNVLLGVLQVLEKRVLLPRDALESNNNQNM